MALETPDAIHACGLFCGAAAFPSGPFAGPIVNSNGIAGFTRVSAGVYDLELEQPIVGNESVCNAQLPVGMPGFTIGAQVRNTDGTLVRVTTFNAAGVAADVPFFYFATLRLLLNGAAITLPLIPASALAPAIESGYVNGLPLSSAGGTTGLVNIGTANDSLNVAQLALTAPQAFNMAVVGANGIDAGAIAAAKAYYVYVIGGDAVPTAVIASLSENTPALPAGYTLFRRIGSLHTLAAAAMILPFTQEGAGTDRKYNFLLTDASRTVLTGGVLAVDTEVPCNTCVPATATSVKATAELNSTVTGNAQLGLNGVYASTLLSNTKDPAVANAYQVTQVDVPVGILTVATVVGLNYKNSAATTALSLTVDGYRESI